VNRTEALPLITDNAAINVPTMPSQNEAQARLRLGSGRFSEVSAT